MNEHVPPAFTNAEWWVLVLGALATAAVLGAAVVLLRWYLWRRP